MSLSVKQGLRFDGLSKYVQFPFGQGLNTGASNLTIELSVFFPYPKTVNTMIFSSLQTTNDRLYIGINNDGYWDMGIQASGQGTGNTITVISDVWHDVKLVYGETNVTLYVNGVQAVQKTYTTYPLASNFHLCTHEINGMGKGYFPRCFVKYLKISDKNGIKAECGFTEGTGTTLTDTSGNGNHGTIYGATWAIKKAGTVKTVRQGLKIRSGNQAYVDFGVNLFPDDFKSRVIFAFRNSTVIATTVWSENYSAATTEKRHDLLMTDSTTLRYQYYRADGTGSALSFLVDSGIVKDRIYDITIEKVGLTLNIIMDGILISSNTLASDARTTVGLSSLATLKLGQKRNTFIGNIDIYYFDIESVVKCDFSNGQGTTITDISGNGNDGTIYGGASWNVKPTNRTLTATR